MKSSKNRLTVGRLRKQSRFRRRSPSLLLLAVLLASPAAAQQTAPFIPPPPPRHVFLSANAGFLQQSQDFTQLAEFPLYDETASFEAQHTIGGGPAVDLAAGVRIAGTFALGVAYGRRTRHSRDVGVSALVPDPLFTNRLRGAAGTLPGLEHDERAVHVQALFNLPVTNEFDVTLFAGPTFFTIDDEIVEGISPIEGVAGSVELSGIGRFRQRQTTTGFHAGIDTAYMFMRHAGAGAMLRYSRGSADLVLPSNSVGPPLRVHAGGLELAVGLRLRF